jgi:pyruvate/2-oxoglutarate dehydrogenase complex dihydrolipoamide dehydrogenase (E3) component
MGSAQEYDMVVIGSGPGGQKAAIASAKLGKSVAIVERGQMIGGVCVQTGTIPSKSANSTARAIGSRRRSPRLICWPAPST